MNSDRSEGRLAPRPPAVDFNQRRKPHATTESNGRDVWNAPLFITFEGPDGGGKSTQASLLGTYLKSLGHNVLLTRQPGGDPVGAELRRIMLDIGRTAVSRRTEVLLMMADRSQSVDMVILPHLMTRGTVICDRYIDSSVAYQGGGRGIEIERIMALNSFATDDLQPDITFLLDIDPSAGLLRQTEKDKMELQDTEFHERVRSIYLEQASRCPNRIKVIDASQSVEAVHSAIIFHFDDTGHPC